MNRALLVGINEYPSQPLNGCVNDVVDMSNFLVDHCGFAMDDVRLLVDGRATKNAIIERLGWLLNGVKAGDRIYFHYSGHGVQMPTRNPQGEVDGLDEAICPVDFDWSDEHTIRDKEFHQIFSAVPKGVEFIWVSDSCHSADLSRAMMRETEGKMMSVRTMLPPADIYWRIQTAKSKKMKAMGFEKAVSNLNLALISGCQSDQTSADAVFGGRANGALTYFLLKVVGSEKPHKMSLSKVVEKVNVALDLENFTQNPQIEGDTQLLNKPFFSK